MGQHPQHCFGSSVEPQWPESLAPVSVMETPTDVVMPLTEVNVWKHRCLADRTHRRPGSIYERARPRVKVLLSGDIIGFPSLGSTQEDILTFPGYWYVSDALNGYCWSRKAKEGEISYTTRQLEDGSLVGFVEVNHHRSQHMQLYHSNMAPAFEHDLMGLYEQDTMYAVISADGPQPHTNRDVTGMEPNTNLDDVKTPTTPTSSAG